MNLIQIAGRLGADAETRFTPSGQKLTTLRVASNVRRGGQDETMWWRVTLWGDRFDRLLPHLKKGSGIMVTGTMQPPTIFQTRDGNNQVALEITGEMITFNPFGGNRNNEKGQGDFSSENFNDNADYSTDNNSSTQETNTPNETFASDDLPF